MRLLLFTISLWLVSGFWAGPARALSISDYTTVVSYVELRTVGGISPALTDTEAVAVAPDFLFPGLGLDSLWITGTEAGVGFIYPFLFDPFLFDPNAPDPADPAALSLFGIAADSGFGGNAEGLAYAGNNRLLVSNAPDESTPASGIYQFFADSLVSTGNVFRTDPANQAEGLAVDPADLGQKEIDLWIADEADDKVYEFELEFAWKNQVTLEDDFATDDDDDGVDRPEGVAVFGEDFLVVDDGGDGSPGRIVQFDDDGEVIGWLSTDIFGSFSIFDPQGIDYDPLRNLIYIVNDGDLDIPGDVPTLLVLSLAGGPTNPNPEPAAAVAFAAQLLAVVVTFRAQRRRRVRRSRADASGVISR